MMPLKLEDFTETSPDGKIISSDDKDEEMRLAAYEDGYGAGWEDATTAQSDARAEREAQTAQHLQTLAFGYHEARQHVLRGIEPLLREITTQILPNMARAALVPVVVETLMPLVDRMAETPVTLRVGPESRDHVDRLLSTAGHGIPFALVEDPTLSDGQVMIAARNRAELAEARIDLGSVTTAIAQALEDFFDIQLTEHAHVG